MERRSLDKRTVKRTKMVLGLRLCNPDVRSTNVVHTLDISSSGAKVGAVREWIEPGTVVGVQYKHLRAQCSVIWSHRFASGETQIGIAFQNGYPQFWGLDLDENCAGVWLSNSER